MEESKFEKSVRVGSSLVSIIFHPVFMPIYGLLLIFYSPTFMVHLPAGLKRIILMLAGINMVVVPLALLPFLKMRNVITSYQIRLREERLIPMTIGTMMYIVTTVILFSYEIPVLIKSFMLAASIGSTLVLVITLIWKISVHAAGMGALMATILVLSIRMESNLIVLWLPILIISGLILSARLYLRSHNPAQIYAGFLVGLASIFIVMMIY